MIRALRIRRESWTMVHTKRRCQDHREPGLILAAGLIALVSSTSAWAAEVEAFAVVLVGNEAGRMEIVEQDTRRFKISWSYEDRGRGPDVEATYQLDEELLPATVSITGVNYYKAPANETLSVNGSTLEWRSPADSGRSASGGFYSSVHGPPAELWLLARALLNDADHTLPLLPTGEARLVEAGVETLPGGRSVRLVEIHGLGMEPASLWLDADDRLFARTIIDGWLSVVRRGEEPLLETLGRREKARRKARYRDLAAAGRTIPDSDILIDNARIFDVESGRLLDANAALVSGSKIAALLTPDEERPPGVVRVDAAGRTLLPGLWDMHTHLQFSDGPLHLAAGVTTVRDLANDHENLEEFITAIENGDTVGPHVFRAGFIDGEGPYAGPTKARIETREQAFEWIDFYADHGYDQIKIYSSIPVELVADMAKRAHERGMRFSGHVPAGMWAEDAVRDGFDEIQHINMVFLNFYKDVVETRNPNRFVKVAERGADLDPTSSSFRAFVKLLLDHGTVVDPTVAVFLDLFTHEPGKLAPSLATAEGRLPPSVYRDNLQGSLAVPPGWEERYAASAANVLKVVGALHASGVPIVAGTDAMAGFALQAELIAYQRAGISPPDILRLVTLGSAEVMGVADEVGRIQPGQRADLILVNGKPDEDMSDIVNVTWVMKAGEIIDPATLYRGMSIEPVGLSRQR